MRAVIVPDFQGGQPQVQEAQTLLFLASWIEQRARSSDAAPEHRVALHLACIGEPPVSVRRLADLSGAEISVHEPIGLHPRHHVGNKLRGLEVAGEADTLLLLDADTLVLGGLESLARWQGKLAAAPDDCPKLSRQQWRRIRAEAGISLADQTGSCLATDLGLPGTPRQLAGCKVPLADSQAGPEYFNSGVLLVPRGCDLRQRWARHIEGIRAMFPEAGGEVRWIQRSDQAGLAVAVHELRQMHWKFQKLPLGVNARWRNLYAGRPSLEEITILHLTTFLHDLAPGPLTRERLWASVRSYLHGKLRRRFARLMLAEACHGRGLGGWRRYCRARRTCRRLEAYLEHLVDEHLRPVLP
jgi:hypothetical protein